MWVGGGAMKIDWGGKIFHLRKSEGHQLLKTQHVSWLHYHIMDYWCDCQRGNCHLCLLRDGFPPDCRTWKTVKGPSSLISRLWKNKQLWFEEAVLHTILQPFSAHLSVGIRAAVTIISKFLTLDCRWRRFLFCLIAIYTRICLRNGPLDDKVGQQGGGGVTSDNCLINQGEISNLLFLYPRFLFLYKLQLIYCSFFP